MAKQSKLAPEDKRVIADVLEQALALEPMTTGLVFGDITDRQLMNLKTRINDANMRGKYDTDVEQYDVKVMVFHVQGARYVRLVKIIHQEQEEKYVE